MKAPAILQTRALAIKAMLLAAAISGMAANLAPQTIKGAPAIRLLTAPK